MSNASGEVTLNWAAGASYAGGRQRRRRDRLPRLRVDRRLRLRRRHGRRRRRHDERHAHRASTRRCPTISKSSPTNAGGESQRLGSRDRAAQRRREASAHRQRLRPLRSHVRISAIRTRTPATASSIASGRATTTASITSCRCTRPFTPRSPACTSPARATRRSSAAP